MPRSQHTDAYATFLQLLRASRLNANVTQIELATRLRTTQSLISKCERGERRLDIVEVREWLKALGLSFVAFSRLLEEQL